MVFSTHRQRNHEFVQSHPFLGKACQPVVGVREFTVRLSDQGASLTRSAGGSCFRPWAKCRVIPPGNAFRRRHRSFLENRPELSRRRITHRADGGLIPLPSSADHGAASLVGKVLRWRSPDYLCERRFFERGALQLRHETQFIERRIYLSFLFFKIKTTICWT